MSDLEKEKLGFIKKHNQEIRPITDQRYLLDDINKVDLKDLPGKIDPAKIENLLEEFETKVFVLEKKNSNSHSKRVLLEAAQTLAFNEVVSIIDHLKKRYPLWRNLFAD